VAVLAGPVAKELDIVKDISPSYVAGFPNTPDGSITSHHSHTACSDPNESTRSMAVGYAHFGDDIQYQLSIDSESGDSIDDLFWKQIECMRRAALCLRHVSPRPRRSCGILGTPYMPRLVMNEARIDLRSRAEPVAEYSS
jgi:hypothetical protein